MSKLIPLAEFAEKYNIDRKYFDVKKSIGVFPPTVFVKQERGKALVDESYFLRRQEFKRSVWDKSCDNYYFLTKHFTNSDLARGLHAIDKKISADSWIQFMQLSLFAMPREGIFVNKVSRVMWKFYRYTRWLVRAAFVLAEVKTEHRDVNVLLDRY